MIVLDNDSSDPATLAYFEQAAQRGVRLIRIGGPFNFAKIVNKGASIATGQFLLLLNNDVEALGPGWLDEMLGRIAEPDVGAVGATLVWPSGVVQHGGVVLGPGFDASHAFNDRIDGDPGYADLLRAAHEVSAVTAACLLTDRSLFLDVGGFDGMHFPVNYNDVDYCLKLRARGLRVVQTPYAKLLHRQSASRGLDLRADQHERLQREVRNLRAAWGDVLLSDPYYSPLLSLDNIPFTGLAWPPRPARPRQNFSAPARICRPGFRRGKAAPPAFAQTRHSKIARAGKLAVKPAPAYVAMAPPFAGSSRHVQSQSLRHSGRRRAGCAFQHRAARSGPARRADRHSLLRRLPFRPAPGAQRLGQFALSDGPRP